MAIFFLGFSFFSGLQAAMACGLVEGIFQHWGLDFQWPGWPLVQLTFVDDVLAMCVASNVVWGPLGFRMLACLLVG